MASEERFDVVYLVLSGTTTVGGTKVEGIALYALKNAVLLALTDLAALLFYFTIAGMLLT